MSHFKSRSFHVLNLVPSAKNMKRLIFESIKSYVSNLSRPMNWVQVAHMGIFHYGATLFQTSNFSYAESNEY